MVMAANLHHEMNGKEKMAARGQIDIPSNAPRNPPLHPSAIAFCCCTTPAKKDTQRAATGARLFPIRRIDAAVFPAFVVECTSKYSSSYLPGGALQQETTKRGYQATPVSSGVETICFLETLSFQNDGFEKERRRSVVFAMEGMRFT